MCDQQKIMLNYAVSRFITHTDQSMMNGYIFRERKVLELPFSFHCHPTGF